MNLGTLNPVLDRELRQRSRSIRSIIILTLFLLLLTAVMWLAYEGNRSTAQFGNPLEAITTGAGRSMFEWVLAAELVLVLFLIPGVSAGAVAGERDRQTLIPLQVTMLGPIQIFFGKVLASSSFLLLLIVGSAPILAVPYLVGGISLTQVLLSLLTLLVVGVLLAVIGVGCSSIFRRTQTATLAAYAVVLALVFGTVIVMAVIGIFEVTRADPDDDVRPRIVAIYPNPFLAVADAAGDIGSFRGPFSPIKQAVFESTRDREVFIEGDIAFDARNGQPIGPADAGGPSLLWLRSLGSLGVIAAVFGVVGVRRLRAPQREMSI